MSRDPSNASIGVSAARLRLAVFATMALLLTVYIAARFDLRLARVHMEYQHGAASDYGRPIADVSIALLLAALFQLSQMLRRIAAGELFTTAVIRHFRGFAWWLLLMALFELIAPVVAALFVGAHTEPHQIRLVLDMRDLLTVGTTLLLFLLASLLERARRLDEEMREIV
jgi:Protein of unknown function (DUF2975)